MWVWVRDYSRRVVARRTTASEVVPTIRYQDQEGMWQSRPRKASPFVARGRPSRSRSHSRRRSRQHRHSDDSSDSRSSRSSRSSSSSSHHGHRRRHHRHHCGRSSSLEEFPESPFSSCVTAPAKYLVRKISKD